MIYHLFQWFARLGLDIPGMGLLSYLSVRAMFSSVTALLVAIFAGKRIILKLQKLQIGEEIRDLGLEGQMSKKGTPTMGGVIIIISLLSGVLLFADLTNIYTILLIITTLWLGALGFADDYIKVFKKDKEGMSPQTKLIGQIGLGFVIAATVCFSDQIVVREKVEQEITEDSVEFQIPRQDVVKSTKTTIPFVKNHEFDYSWLSPFKGRWGWYCKWAIYMLMIVIVITACSNGTNLTDGLDGLATGSSAIVGIVLGIFAWLGGNLINSDYLNIMYIPGSGEIAVFMSAFAGSLLGFLWYNSFPAGVFMGDTGSLTIGGIIGVSAVLIRKELLLPILCGIFLVESVSVLMQRYYFKYTKKKYGEGRRIFRMSPLHHHFQTPNGRVQSLITKPSQVMPEAKITVRFWIIGIILAVATIGMLKVR